MAKIHQMIYGLESKPPIAILGLLSLQHVLVAIGDLALPVMLVNAIGGCGNQMDWVLQMSMIAIACGTLLQVQKRGIGSGYLIPHSATSIFLAPCLLAAQVGGLAMVAGMLVVAGSGQILFTGLLRRFRNLFPLYISGEILLINGLVILHAAVPRLLGCGTTHDILDWHLPVIGIFTLMVMAGFLSIGGKRFRLYGLALGMAFGYLASLALNSDIDGLLAAVGSAPFFGFPKWRHPGIDFDASLLCPFLIAGLCVVMKGNGLIAKGHEINETPTSADRQQRLHKGLVADGVGTLFSGLLGGYGTSMCASNFGISTLGRATARRIGNGFAAVFLMLVFLPKFSAALGHMPQPVMGATMFFIGIQLVRIGLQIIRTAPKCQCPIIFVGLPVLMGA
jgi:NCS2 family nucleobase:cation symporter-2